MFLFPGTLKSQDAVRDLDQVYGPDQTLYNGKKYKFIAPPGTTGHQYLSSKLYAPGSVTIQGITYRDVSLNYDIFNQQLVLQYANEKSPWNYIEISKAWLQGFRLKDKYFELLQLEQEPHFYQVLGEGSCRILYFYRKNLNLNDAIGSTNFIFTPAPIRDTYVLKEGQLKPYTTKRSLIKLFNPEHRPEINNYMRKNKIKIKKASDQVMSDLITFISRLR